MPVAARLGFLLTLTPNLAKANRVTRQNWKVKSSTLKTAYLVPTWHIIFDCHCIMSYGTGPIMARLTNRVFQAHARSGSATRHCRPA